MSDVEAIYARESVEHWENSPLDARIYGSETSQQPPAEGAAGPDIKLLLEATYHAAAAGDTNAAAAVLYNHLYNGPEAHLTSVQGSYEMALDILTHLFPFRQLSLDPRTDHAQSRRWIMHETAACLHMLGRLTDAASMANRAASAALADNDQHNAAITYHNLAETYLVSGALRSCRSTVELALEAAERSRDRQDELVAKTLLGHLDNLSGDNENAESAYESALGIAIDDTGVPALYSLSGLRYADHLMTSGRQQDALQVAQFNLEFCKNRGWQSDVALILAQTTIIPSNLTLDELKVRSIDAVDLARSLGAKQALTTVLLARGQFMNLQNVPRMALAASNEALSLAQLHGFRCIEVDVRTQLASTYAALENRINAHAEAYLAMQLADELDYGRGHALASAILADIGN